ncbi:MAG: glycosyltransferase family 9 protein, partial [Acidobacteriota bacterium]|nr:glycosyltransferase family 9 protein [Acidobacteriota bacterium]
MNLTPQNILIIDFGQIGDVILSLPTLKAVRERFPAAQITAMIGKSGAEIIEISGFVDERITVDRVKLRDGKKLESIKEVLKIVRDVRRRKFDFVIDLHSLYETNLLGYLSGAKHRLYINRENRSLD